MNGSCQILDDAGRSYHRTGENPVGLPFDSTISVEIVSSCNPRSLRRVQPRYAVSSLVLLPPRMGALGDN